MLKTSVIDRFRARVGTWIRSRVHWVTDQRTNLLGEPAAGFALVTILGREFYDEKFVRYPVRRWGDLARVLSLENSSRRSVLSVIGPLVDDHREVRFFDLKIPDGHSNPRSLFTVPESLLLSATFSRGTVVTVSRASVRYFLSGNFPSQVAGGLVRSAELYALAAGLSMDRATELVDPQDLRDRFLMGLRSIEFPTFYRCIDSALKNWLREKWRPTAAIFAVLFSVYLLLASLYLEGMVFWRTHQLEKLGGDVASLVESQRRIDRAANEHQAISRLFGGKSPSFRIWEVAGEVWRLGGSFTVINASGSKVTVRGSVGNATDLLKKLSGLDSVRLAKFVAPVRTENGLQEFMIDVEFKAGAKSVQ